jgi:hypothetical protein
MRNLFLLSFLSLLNINGLSQKKNSFETPWKATSNDSIMEWFTDRLDNTSDSLLFETFNRLGVDTDSVEWIYPSREFYTLHKNGWDFYSRRIYTVNNKDKEIVITQKNTSENKLPNSLFMLSYLYKDGVTSLVLIEYY